MAVIHLNNSVVIKSIATSAFIITEVEVVGNEAFAIGHGCMADMKVSMSVTLVSSTTVEVGYTVINRQNRTLSYKGKFVQNRCSSLSEQLTRALACL